MLAQGIGGLGRMIGPLVAGALFALAAGWPFWLGGALGVVGLLLAAPALPGRPPLRLPGTKPIIPVPAAAAAPAADPVGSPAERQLAATDHTR